ncbi:MAG: hypothetical protein R2932_40680 [Caldilineaceae bacterium]
MNDKGDVDVGPNQFQNYPSTLGYNNNSVSTIVTGTLQSAASTTYHLQVYVNLGCTVTAGCQGRVLLTETNVTTDGNGDSRFQRQCRYAAAEWLYLSATATGSSRQHIGICRCGG